MKGGDDAIIDVDGTASDVPEQREPFSFRIVVHVNFPQDLNILNGVYYICQ